MAKTLLVFAPHPDDAEFFAGGTIARLVSEGWKAIVVTITDGRCGSFELDADTLARTRMEEARQGASILGAEPPIFLGYRDQELDRLPPGVLRENFILLLRQHRPEMVIAEDVLAGQELHPDHRVVARAAAEAVRYAHLPLVHPEHGQAGLQPHFVTEKYFYGGTPETHNKFVDITEFLEKKLQAMAAHQTQVDFLVQEILSQVQSAGLDLSAILGEAAIDPTAALTGVLQAEASTTGMRAGAMYAEAFRYIRYDPIVENLLAGRMEER